MCVFVFVCDCDYMCSVHIVHTCMSACMRVNVYIFEDVCECYCVDNISVVFMCML